MAYLDGARWSHRLAWSVPLSPLAKRLEAHRQARLPLCDLTVSNPTRCELDVPAALLRPLGHARGLDYAPDPQGPWHARRALAAEYQASGQTVDPRRLVLTASTSEAYSWLLKLLCDPGERVLVPAPSYPLFDFLCGLEGVCVDRYPIAFDGAWHIDIDVLAARAPGARAVVVVNPNNPTGSFLHPAEREHLVELAGRHHLALIVDEVFADFRLDAAPQRVTTLVDETRVLTFSLSGLSKTMGLPQLKLSWIHVGGPAEQAAAALDRLGLIADTYLSVSTPVALALPELLGYRNARGQAITERIRTNYAAITRCLAGTPLSLLPAQGGWTAILRLPRVQTDEQWALELLDHDGLLVQPGYFYELPIEACVVLSLLTPPAQLKQGLETMVARVLASAPP